LSLDIKEALKPLHIKELPTGWLGKVHALHKAVKQAKGNWYLFAFYILYRLFLLKLYR